ncbi:MAG: redoxin domain-containing protein [Myxococcales bacterium]|nr:redoxin domain-containing protein [Myxococcales bacterium]MCB9750364.1 redoxin domain-containing protein [Myxococcales bacterium]
MTWPLVLVLGGCASRAPSAASATSPPPREPLVEEGAPLPDPTLAPTNREPGERIELMIPLIGGQSLPLSRLRGRVVVVELTATWVERWPETYAFYNRLIEEHGPEQLAVVLVALDNERSSLSPEPGTRGPGFELAWDPQGALAARLQAAALPTVIVLDREGVMVHAQGGGPAGATEILEGRVRDVVRASGQPSP